jgi:hypothetical protein
MVMGARAGFMVGVALAFANRVVSQHRHTAARVQNAGVPRVPDILVAAVAVNDDKGGDFAGRGFGQRVGEVQDGWDAQAKLRRISEALGADARRGNEPAVGAGLEGGQRLRHKKVVVDLPAPLPHLGRGEQAIDGKTAESGRQPGKTTKDGGPTEDEPRASIQTAGTS